MQLCDKCLERARRTFAFQAFTEYRCKACGEKFVHFTSDTPCFCKKCAEEEKICQRCGKKVDEGRSES